MRKFQIKCGDLDGVFGGHGYKDAFQRAVRKTLPESLTALYRFRECDAKGRPHGVWFYADAQRHLPLNLVAQGPHQ